jgi:hypothetical protein
MPSRSGISNAVLAAWGGIELEALDNHSLKSLAEGTSPKKGLLIDFIGNLTRSAQEGLPVYRIAGGAGFVWVASFDHKGRGVLRFAAVDASALQLGPLAVERPSASPKDQQPSRLQNELSSDISTRTDAETVARLQTELSTVLKAKAGAELAAQKARTDAEIARNELEFAIDDANAAKEEVDKLKADDGMSLSYISRIMLIDTLTAAFLLLIVWALSRISRASPRHKLSGGRPPRASGAHKHAFEEGAVPLFATALIRSTEAERSIDQHGVVGIAPSAAQSKIREGKRRAAWETGIDEDELRYRLAFFFENRRFRLVVDEKGNSIQRSTVCFGIREDGLTHPGL